MSWNAIKVTIGSSPVRIAKVPTYANRLIVTPLPGSSAGTVDVLNQEFADGESLSDTDQNRIAQLGPATSTAPATPFRLDRIEGQPPINVQEYIIHGSHATDTVQVAWDLAG